MIKIEHWFDSEGRTIYDGVQDGRHFNAKFHLKSESQLITFF